MASSEPSSNDLIQAPPRIVRLDAQDNVGVAACDLKPGQTADCAGRPIAVCHAVPTGHKVALRAIRQGEKIVKFAAPIGSATCNIEPGDHVHLHNLKSDYLPTYTLNEEMSYVRSAWDA